MRWALLTLTLTAVYLLVLASAKPGDVLTGLALSGALAAVLRRSSHSTPAPGHLPALARVRSLPRFLSRSLLDLVRGTWHVAAFAIARRPVEHPGFVEIPLGERSPSGVVAWGLLTGFSPDEIVVDIDEERGTAIIHVLDDRDPEAVRRRHAEAYERTTGKVFP